MKKHPPYDIIVIGGSAGSLGPLISLLKAKPEWFRIPILIIIHRLKNTKSQLHKIMANESGLPDFIEPEDKEPIKNGQVYLAPQNYHILIEKDHSFSLDYSEPVNFSRPSIDVSFESVSEVYKHRSLAILLSGANKDGAKGMKAILAKKGSCIVQLPETAEYPAMPEAAIKINPAVRILKIDEIISYLFQNK